MHVSGKLSPVHEGQLKFYFSIQQAEKLAKASTETFKSPTCPLQVCCWASMREGMLPTNLYWEVCVLFTSFPTISHLSLVPTLIIQRQHAVFI